MVYVHVPFCRTRCTYCGFYSELLRHSDRGSDFVGALLEEIRLCGGDAASLCGLPAPQDGAPEGALSAPRTLYFGGGTPSLLPACTLERVTAALAARGLYDRDSCEEFTVEVNPDDVLCGGPEYAEALRRVGVNRISMGVQSFDDALLHRMGRRHDTSGAFEAYGILRRAGFDNISMDLIFGFAPSLDVEALKKHLGALEGGIPEHISCYQLSIEPGSGLEKMIDRGLYTMPSDEQCALQYYALCSLLREVGYEHYEISNWALPGRRSRHNSAYWHHLPYIGFGPGAHSLFIGQDGRLSRRWNSPDLASYIAAARRGCFDDVRAGETLTAQQVHDERVMLGLRTAEGIDGRRIPEDRWFIADTIILDTLSK